jgi:predicted transcriptional regulator
MKPTILRPDPSVSRSSILPICLDYTKNFVLVSSYEDDRAAMSIHRKPTMPRPTDGELEILRVLWERGASTVREVHDVLEARRPAGYTTVLKLLQIMTEKGLVRRNETERAHVYAARVPREETERQLVTDLLDRAFAGSASALVMRALSSKKTSPQELARIRELLDAMEGGKR